MIVHAVLVENSSQAPALFLRREDAGRAQHILEDEPGWQIRTEAIEFGFSRN